MNEPFGGPCGEADFMSIDDYKTEFSPCRLYRYTLWRKVPVTFNFEDRPSSYVQFIGLNPSTADEIKDDPTIRRCRAYASAWGFTRMCMTNIFAWRDTDPAKMKLASDPIGPDNDSWLLRIAFKADLVVACWGNHGSFMQRSEAVRKLLPKLHCLKVTGTFEPSHPLYLKKDLMPIPYDSDTPSLR